MMKLASMLAAAALAAVPLAAHAQNHDGYRGDGHDRYARSATSHGYDANARTYDRHDRRADWRADGRGRVYAYGGRYRQGDGGRFDRFDDDRFRGGVTLGLGYGGYHPYGGGYYDVGGYPADGYGADVTYSYPDEYGTYQPFAYGYSARDDAYYAGAPNDDRAYDDDRAYGDGYDDAAPNVGWSTGGPPVDCGRWIWREDRGAYEWAPVTCR
jgi:hypothetical protein